jgi:hypothetical protein
MANGTIAFDTLSTSGQISGTATSVDADYLAYGSAKSWINFNGTGTIAARDSFNSASLTDHGTSDYTHTITTAMSNANFSAHATGDVGTVGDFAVACTYDSTRARTTTTISIRIGTTGGAAADTDVASITINGDSA